MSLAVGKTALANSIESSWSEDYNTAELAAMGFSDASQTFAETGVPMTVDTGLEASGQAVAGSVTIDPGAVTGTGSGGIDIPSPGSGLEAAVTTLTSALTAIFTEEVNTAELAAQNVADAIFAFLSEAMILTNFTGTVPPGQAVPPPVGPVGPGAFTGTGIGGIDSTSGSGLASVISVLIESIISDWSAEYNTPEQCAESIANALLSFYQEALINTTDIGTASGGTAVVNPLTLSGVTTTPSTASGTGTGTIA